MHGRLDYPPAVRRFRISAGQRLVRLTALAGVAIVVVSGCSADEQQASTELPPATSASAEQTPELPPLGPEDFPVPNEARVQDEAGAEAFLDYFIELINRQQAIPEGQPLRDLGPDCRQCLVVAQRFDEASAAGFKIRGGELSIIDGPGTALQDDRANLSFIARAEPATVVDSSGDPVPGEQQAAQERLPSALSLTWSPERNSWLASGLSFG
jgi:hypothetical protein